MENLLEAHREYHRARGHSLRRVANELGVTQPCLSMILNGRRRRTPALRRAIECYLVPKQSGTLSQVLKRFIGKNTHRSPKTERAIRQRVTPFVDYLARHGVYDPLNMGRDHIGGFLREIAQGRMSNRVLGGYSKPKSTAAYNYASSPGLGRRGWLCRLTLSLIDRLSLLRSARSSHRPSWLWSENTTRSMFQSW